MADDWDPFADPSDAAPAATVQSSAVTTSASEPAEGAEPWQEFEQDDIFAALRVPQKEPKHWEIDEFTTLLDNFFGIEDDNDMVALKAAMKPIVEACADDGSMMGPLWRRAVPIMMDLVDSKKTEEVKRPNLFGLLVDHNMGFLTDADSEKMSEIAVDWPTEGEPCGTVVFLYGWGGANVGDLVDIAGLYRELFPGAVICRMQCNRKASFGLRVQCGCAIKTALAAWSTAPSGSPHKLLVHLFSNAGFFTHTEMLQDRQHYTPGLPGMRKLPDPPLLVSGCVGGPAVIFICTPLRNALTLGAQDSKSSFGVLYQKCFRGGPRSGWTGGVSPAMAACPQFLALSPVFHFLNTNLHDLFGLQIVHGRASLPAVLASAGAGMVETLLTFGSQSRNAQMAYNKSFVQFSSLMEGSRRALQLNSVISVWGPGAGAMAARNMVSIAGARVLSPWLQENLPAGVASGNARATLCDISSSLLCSPISAPIHQLFNFLVTTPDVGTMPQKEKWGLARKFLNQQYFVPLPRQMTLSVDLSKEPPEQRYSWRLSRIAVRDLAMRGVYITSVFTLFMSIERFLIATMRPS